MFKASLLTTGKILTVIANFATKSFLKVQKVIKNITLSIINLRSKFVLMGTFLKELFGGIADQISGIFDRDLNKIRKGQERSENAFKSGALARRKFLREELALLNKKGKGGETNKKASVLNETKKKASVLSEGPQVFGDFVPLKTKGLGAGKESSTSVDGIKSGRPTHINIDIGKLIENMNITAANVDDLTGQIKDQVAAALFSAVNNVNNIAGA